MEKWALIPRNNEYMVSSYGNIMRVDGKYNNKPGVFKNLTPSKNGRGYLFVSLGGGSHPGVHVLVAEAFIGPRLRGYDVHHKDNDKTNNVLSNLEYVRHSDNVKLAFLLLDKL